MTEADRTLISALIVFVAEDGGSPEIEASLRAMERALRWRKGISAGASFSVAVAAQEAVRAWQSGGLSPALNRRGYARLALAEYFIPRRDEALKGLSARATT